MVKRTAGLDLIDALAAVESKRFCVFAFASLQRVSLSSTRGEQEKNRKKNKTTILLSNVCVPTAERTNVIDHIKTHCTPRALLPSSSFFFLLLSKLYVPLVLFALVRGSAPPPLPSHYLSTSGKQSLSRLTAGNSEDDGAFFVRSSALFSFFLLSSSTIGFYHFSFCLCCDDLITVSDNESHCYFQMLILFVLVFLKLEQPFVWCCVVALTSSGKCSYPVTSSPSATISISSTNAPPFGGKVRLWETCFVPSIGQQKQNESFSQQQVSCLLFAQRKQTARSRCCRGAITSSPFTSSYRRAACLARSRANSEPCAIT